MAKQIKNRREDLYIDNVPPVIPAGIVTNTDYASASTAGVLRISTSYGVAVASTGNLTAATRTAEQYGTAPGTLILGKGTLENVINALITKAIADLCGAVESDDVGTTYTMQSIEKTADGYTFVGGKTPPTP